MVHNPRIVNDVKTIIDNIDDLNRYIFDCDRMVGLMFKYKKTVYIVHYSSRDGSTYLYDYFNVSKCGKSYIDDDELLIVNILFFNNQRIINIINRFNNVDIEALITIDDFDIVASELIDDYSNYDSSQVDDNLLPKLHFDDFNVIEKAQMPFKMK